MLFHYRSMLGPYVDQVPFARPVLDGGWIGVELFFVLSGFVLARKYIDEVGRRPTPAVVLRFLWNRIARVWPAWAVVTVLMGACILGSARRRLERRPRRPPPGDRRHGLPASADDDPDVGAPEPVRCELPGARVVDQRRVARLPRLPRALRGVAAAQPAASLDQPRAGAGHDDAAGVRGLPPRPAGLHRELGHADRLRLHGRHVAGSRPEGPGALGACRARGLAGDVDRAGRRRPGLRLGDLACRRAAGRGLPRGRGRGVSRADRGAHADRPGAVALGSLVPPSSTAGRSPTASTWSTSRSSRRCSP